MPHTTCFALAVAAIGFTASLVRAEMAGPSFSCARPSEIEAVICADPALSANDRRMTAFYQTAKAGPLGLGSNQLAAQIEWLKGRDKDCAKGAWRTARLKSLRDCIVGEYDDRLRALAVTNLLATPRDSLAELQRVDPKAAPLYEATLDYATIDDTTQRAKTVERLLAPLYAAMDQGSKDQLSAVAGKPTTAHDAAGSDNAFAAFFVVSAVFENANLTWPCAALLERPGLIEGLGSFFGGAIDSSVPGSDCEAAMPPVPEMAALRDSAVDVQPPCEGSIRFSLGREYAKLGDAVMLHRTEVWASNTATRNEADPDEKAFRRKHAGAIAASTHAMTAYYQRTFAVTPVKAQLDASTAVDALVSGAFGLCE